MPKQKEEPPRLRAKVRAQLPGESWREHVSPGAAKAHDYPLGPAREEARALRKKGRLIAAHKREKAAYKIRVRGYQRKYSGKETVEKAVTYNAWKVGPAAKKRIEVRLRKKTKSEMRNETIKAIGGSLGGVRTIGALGLGAGGASLVDMKNDAQKAKKKVGEVIRHKVNPEDVEKGLAVYQITAETMVRDVALRSPSEIAKYDDLSLVEIAKFVNLIKPLKNIAAGGQKAYAQGGLEGLQTYGRQQWNAPRNTFGGQSVAQKATEAMANPTARKAAIGAGAVGATGLAAYGAKKMLAPAVKKKAKKYALYGAAGLGGTVAAGTALGNAATNR